MAFVTNANGTILDRKSMEDDLFWDIRGGAGGEFWDHYFVEDKVSSSSNNCRSVQCRSPFTSYFKAKSDFVRKPISRTGLEGILKQLLQKDVPSMIWTPYGGMMSKISESKIPFPHRKGNRFIIQYVTSWNTEDKDLEAKQLGWIHNLYIYMERYVCRSPRAAYVYYRNLDLGMNEDRSTSFLQAVHGVESISRITSKD
ncbi:hypothetical protein POM88_035229 [Heracleum sosnowskyi]|uniref:Uncharacterized protein n=1 Tax=Heracleum sosnowskyi TaxID=360622 RepID=A0AAD8MDS4_9APIA|nr:hypothetical protein POM88_035229 [Heracleum sosnowskyi]